MRLEKGLGELGARNMIGGGLKNPKESFSKDGRKM